MLNATMEAVAVTSHQRRAVGVVRVSKVGGREGDHFVSPSEQRGRIVQACAASALHLVDVHEELDVSAGLPIDKRPGLSAAVAAIEARRADTLVVAYFDRLVRNLRVQAEIVERVERAGGSILAVDIGHVRADTASHWLSSTMLGAVAEYHRRMVAERTAEAKIRSVKAGVPPYPEVIAGYRSGPDRRLVVHEHEASAVREAFAFRADGGSWSEVRRLLAARGVHRTHHAVVRLLESRVVLGELRFGDIVNPDSHAPIVDRATWERAQSRKRSPGVPGRRSSRLLSRLRLLRCSTCGGAMTLGSQWTRSGAQKRAYPFYKCLGQSTVCPRRTAVAAPIAEGAVVARVRELLADQSATASASTELIEAEAEAAVRRAELDRAIAVLSVVGDVPTARQKLIELRDAADAADERVTELRRIAGVGLTINAASDWDALTFDERRALIITVIRRVVVSPSRPGRFDPGRIRIVAVGEPDSE